MSGLSFSFVLGGGVLVEAVYVVGVLVVVVVVVERMVEVVGEVISVAV